MFDQEFLKNTNKIREHLTSNHCVVMLHRDRRKYKVKKKSTEE